jgi:hypothetical protein
MGKLTGMWIVRFDDQEQYAEDGEIIAEIGNEFILVRMRNTVANGPPASSRLFAISDLATDNVRFFPDEAALDNWHAFLAAGPVTVIPFDRGGR